MKSNNQGVKEKFNQTDSATTQQSEVPHPGEYLKLCSLQRNRCTKTKKHGPMKEQSKTPEKELSDEERDNLSDAEFKTPVIRMLTEMIQFSCKMKEEMKATESEIKKNIQGTNSEGKETRTQISDMEQKEEIKLNPNRMKKQEFKKLERLRNLWDNLKHSNIRITGVPERRRIRARN